MAEIQKVNVATTAATTQAKDVKQTMEAKVESSEAKALQEAKTNENANVDVEIAEEAPKEEKKGFWSTLGSAFKSLFTSDNTAGKTAGGLFGSGSGAGLGALIGGIFFGPIGAMVGGLIGGLFGGVGGAMVGDNIQEKLENDGQLVDGVDNPDPKAGTVEETIDEDGNKIVTQYDEYGQKTTTKYDPEGNKLSETTEWKDPIKDGYVYGTTTIEYDQDGKETAKIITYDNNGDGKPEKEVTQRPQPDGGNYSYEKQFDENGTLVKTIEKGVDGVDDMYCDTEYDANGNPVTEKLYNAETGEIYSEVTYEYDENGNQIKKTKDENAEAQLELT